MKDYTTQMVRDRIEIICNQKGVKPTTAAKESGAGQSAVANLKRGSMLAADSLAKIADYLECSVDFLLGRTDKPKPEADVIKDNHGSAFIGANVTELPVTIVQSDNHQLDEMQKELLHRFGELPFTEKLKVMQELVEKTEGV